MGELVVIDQHAAHERILYQEFLDQYKKNILEKSKKISFSKKIHLGKENIMFFEKNADIFRQLGFIFSIEKKIIILEKVPVIFENTDLERVILDFLEDIKQYGKVIKPDLLSDRALSFLACRSAIKAGDKLTIEERLRIVKKLIQLDELYTCPHGRPLKIKISKKELEKMFFRG